MRQSTSIVALTALLTTLGACEAPKAPEEAVPLMTCAAQMPEAVALPTPDVAGAIVQAQSQFHAQMQRAKRLSTLTPLVLDTRQETAAAAPALTQAQEAERLLEAALQSPRGRRILRQALLEQQRQQQVDKMQHDLESLKAQVWRQQHALDQQQQQRSLPVDRPVQMERVAFGQRRAQGVRVVWQGYGAPGWFPGVGQGLVWSQVSGSWVHPATAAWSPCTLRTYEGIRPCDEGLVTPPSRRPFLIPAANTLPRQIPAVNTLPRQIPRFPL